MEDNNNESTCDCHRFIREEHLYSIIKSEVKVTFLEKRIDELQDELRELKRKVG